MRRAGRAGLLNTLFLHPLKETAAAVIAAGILLSAPAALAHPHSFLDAGLGIVVRDAKVSALDVSWLFDDADTEIAVENNDTNGNGRLDPDELQVLAGRMARTTAQFGFHIHLWVDDKPRKTLPVDDFRLAMRGQRLEARFRAALAEPIDPRTQRLLVGLYDESYWIQFTLDPARDITVTGDLPKDCRLETFKDRRTVIYEMVGQKIYPTVTEIRCGQ